MTYQLLWLELAEEQVVEAFLRARAQGVAATFTQVLHSIETRIRISPKTIGESRGLRSFITISHPIAVRYEIHEDEKIVIVTGLHYSNR